VRRDFRARNGIPIARKGFFYENILLFITCRICVFGLLSVKSVFYPPVGNPCLSPGAGSLWLTRPANADLLGRREPRRRSQGGEILNNPTGPLLPAAGIRNRAGSSGRVL